MTNSGQELEQLMALLSSQEWRIFSGKIYSIKDKHGKKIPFIPNAFQKDFYQRKHTKNIILKARQLGFSTLIDIMSLDKVLFSKYKSVGIIADDRDSAELNTPNTPPNTSSPLRSVFTWNVSSIQLGKLS